ncbi:MAG: Flagellar hook-length control protein FliK [Polyangiaceae bacterium]|nr:Flagellar hook-length control protein FliK [Polyangiaceae bacterium]
MRRVLPARSCLVLSCGLAFGLAAACGGTAEVPGNGDDSDSGGEGAAAPTGKGGTGIDLAMGGAGWMGENGGEPPVQVGLRVTADETEILATGEPVVVQLHARFEDGSLPNQVLWTVDDPRVGSVNDDGELRSNGFVAGELTITATVGVHTASVTVHITVAIESDDGALDPDVKDALVTGGEGGDAGVGPDAGFRFLYPYDGTVFPLGLAAPVVQLGGEDADGTYVKLTAGPLSYEAFAEVNGLTRVILPEAVWRGATLSVPSGEAIELSVSKVTGGEVTGPLTERLRIAPGSLKGFVYYNTYRSKLAGDSGAVMRIKPGETAKVLQSGCTVCHSVSAHGNVMVAGVQWDTQNAKVSRAFDLPENGGIQLRNEQSEGRVYSFGGLTPDGTWMLTSGVPASGAKMRGMSGELFSRLVDTSSGATVPAPSLTVKVAMTPNFAPDGSRVAFSNHDKSAAGHVLSVASFDAAQSPPEFGEVEDVVTDSKRVVAWPSFVPDASAVLFHAGDSFDTAKPGGGALYGDVHLVDVESKKVNELRALNGFDADGRLYLPGGAAQEAHLNYEPSVLPVPVGGYYWVLFTSRRTYGNTIAPGGSVERGDDIWGVPVPPATESPSPRKKIWVAAIDIDHQAVADPSHPAFYLPGQELESGNMRAFGALEPCKKRGKGCESAAECCDGFCRETSRDEAGAPVLTCSPPPENACSNVDEACKKASDCCSSRSLCINGRCAAPPPVVE